ALSEDLPQVLDSRGGSHVTNVPPFDVDDFSSWKDRFLVYLDGLEPYLLEILENESYVPISPASTFENILIKPKKQWSHEDRKLANQDKRLKSIIISCLPNDVMKSVIKCTIAKSMWNYLILIHKGPSDIRDTKIPALRLKFNAFKALEGEKVKETYYKLEILLNELENKDVKIPQAKVNATFVNSPPKKWLGMNQTLRANKVIKNDSLATLSTSKTLISNTCFQESDLDVEEDTRSSSKILANLNVEFHKRALLANQKRFYKRSRKVGKEHACFISFSFRAIKLELAKKRLPTRSNTTREDLTTLLAQSFPPEELQKLRNDFLIVPQQHHVDIFTEAWTHFIQGLSYKKSLHQGSNLWLQDLALYENESWHVPRDFANPVKAISLPQDVPSTSDRRLIKPENQVQRLMEAHLAPNATILNQSLAEQNKNPSSPKCVHFINSIIILNKEDETKEEGSVKTITTECEDHEMTVEREGFRGRN
ncbi:hypothetical protein Tco_0926321, partial [Tanacetum coccineum]